MLNRLSKETHAQFMPNLIILGTHESQLEQYRARDDGIFQCIESMEKIGYSQINDDYCDCLDGSDEPGTSACANGRFVCSFQEKFKNYPVVIPSSKVNDGVCDCCDGSDEWKGQRPLVLLPGRKKNGGLCGKCFKAKKFFLEELQQKLHKFSAPCPRLCLR